MGYLLLLRGGEREKKGKGRGRKQRGMPHLRLA